jgi:hypothetical protein
MQDGRATMSSPTCRGHDRTAPTHCQATLRAESRASMSVNHGARAQRCAPAVIAAHRTAPVRTRAGPRRSGRAADRGAHLGNSAAPARPSAGQGLRHPAGDPAGLVLRNYVKDAGPFTLLLPACGLRHAHFSCWRRGGHGVPRPLAGRGSLGDEENQDSAQ